MKKKYVLLSVFLSLSILLVAQPKSKEEKIKIDLYGYINYESIFDSHESIFTRDAELYLYPAPPSEDAATGDDLNANAQLEMLALQSRVGTKIKGPDILGAETSGAIEGDFFGTSEQNKNQFRIRHAFMKLKWEKAALLMGQYWHPMFTPEVFPRVLSFGASTIYNPLNRAPQIRFTYFPLSDLKMSLSAIEHGYHYSKGPEDAQRNAALPDMQFQLIYGKKSTFQTGITAGYMELEPREYTPTGVNDAQIGTYNLEWFTSIKAGNFSFQTKALYGQNMSQYVMLGGYGRLLSDTADVVDFGYTPYKIYSLWAELSYQATDQLQIGLFGGLTGNLGSEDKIDPDHTFARGSDISYNYRISPRISYKINKLRFGLEYLYNIAAYGKGVPDDFGVYDETEETVNHRIVLAAFFYF